MRHVGVCGRLFVRPATDAARSSRQPSLDRMYEDWGLRFVEHVDVEVTDDPDALQQFIGRFVRRLDAT